MTSETRPPAHPEPGSASEIDELTELYALLSRLPGDDLQRRARALLEQVERRESRLRAVVHDQSELVFRFHAGGRVTFVNQACCRYWRRERVDLLGRPVQSLLPKDGWQRLLRTARRLSPAEPVVQLEPRVLGPDGQPRYHEWTMRLIRGSADPQERNKVVGGDEYQVVARDVTERQQQQQLLAQHIAERRRVESELRSALDRTHGQLVEALDELERLRALEGDQMPS
jgi:PAS domain S-box-containing protein